MRVHVLQQCVERTASGSTVGETTAIRSLGIPSWVATDSADSSDGAQNRQRRYAVASSRSTNDSVAATGAGCSARNRSADT